MARIGWWQHHDQSRQQAWLDIARAARTHSATALTDVAKAALTGALGYVTCGLGTRRHLDLAVIALTACHLTGRPARTPCRTR
jgi:hypothetical protein